MFRSRPLLPICALALCACIELDEFPDESIVTGPRVLAVVADPPEVTPGKSLSISVLVANAGELDVEYSVCAVFDSPFGGGSQFGERDDEDCRNGSVLRGSGQTWNVSADEIAAVWANADLAGMTFGGALPSEAIATLLAIVGMPVLVDVSIDADGRKLRAAKRVLVSGSPTPHTNPPPPSFAFGKIAVRADPDEPWSCTSDEPLRVRAGAEVELAPTAPDGEETWIEPYRVVNARGEVEDRMERAFYSWFATGGDFESHVTRAPLRNQVWKAPPTPGEHRLWLVVRDGHGGTSACGVDVRVR